MLVSLLPQTDFVPNLRRCLQFDGSKDGEGLDINSLTAKITGEMQQLLSSFGKPKEGGLLGNLMGGLGGAKS